MNAGAWIIELINLDIILITIGLAWLGALLGAFMGNAMGGYCRHLGVLIAATVPSGFAGVLAFILVVGLPPDNAEFSQAAWYFIEILFILFGPWLIIQQMRDEAYCEECKQSYEELGRLWGGVDSTPETIRLALSSDSWNEALVGKDKQQAAGGSIELTGQFCSTCRDAIIDATYIAGDGESKALFFSAFAPGGELEELKRQFKPNAE